MNHYRAYNGTEEHVGTAGQIAKKIGVCLDTVYDRARTGRPTEKGYSIELFEENLKVFTNEEAPFYEFAGKIAGEMIKDYNRDPSETNKKALLGWWFETLTLGLVDPWSIINKKQKKSLKGTKMTRIDPHEFSAKKLDDLIIDSGKNLTEISRASGVNRASLQNYLDGFLRPSRESLIKLCKTFGVKPEYFKGDHYE